MHTFRIKTTKGGPLYTRGGTMGVFCFFLKFGQQIVQTKNLFSPHMKKKVQQTDGMFHVRGGEISCSDLVYCCLTPQQQPGSFGLGNEKK